MVAAERKEAASCTPVLETKPRFQDEPSCRELTDRTSLAVRQKQSSSAAPDATSNQAASSIEANCSFNLKICTLTSLG